ncbi:hypothetical protein THRCLA_00474 [Thraustotheca clavata]|uniref:Cysteine/serine-rich nuclear protein N-terminal domain-containing protein n=1 Tax=Thraustotheca clavata TaxID=74557 RepID=A0A1W0ABG6_9STRA|nr:hypothetical protein THRCLA_00474 [Thraustotheca clavata]
MRGDCSIARRIWDQRGCSKAKKRVQFSTETTYYFDIAYGGSALPSESGPPIGLAASHCHRTTTNVDAANINGKRKQLRKYDHLERIELLKAADYHVKEIAQFCFEAMDVRKHRQDTRTRLASKRRRAAARRVLLHRRPRMMQPLLNNNEESSSDNYSSCDEESANTTMAMYISYSKKAASTPSSPLNIDCDLQQLCAPRRVHFGIATTYLFNVAHGGSALPKKTGPAIGMTMHHIDVEQVHLEDIDDLDKCGSVRKFEHLERVEMLKMANYSGRDIADFCMQAIEVRKTREETRNEVRRNRKRTIAMEKQQNNKRNRQNHDLD